MSDDNNRSSSETAYRAVVEYQEAGKRAERLKGWSPDTSNTQSTPLVVWGAMLGLLIGAFSGGSHGFLVSLVVMALWMAIGAGLAWGAGKTFRLCMRMLGFVFRTAKKVVKGQPLEPPV